MNITHYLTKTKESRLILIWFCPNKLEFEKREVEVGFDASDLTQDKFNDIFLPIVNEAKETISRNYRTKERDDL